MKSNTLITVLITAVVIGGGVYFWQSAQSSPAQFNCEQSGGTFSAGKCECPTEPMVAGAPAFTYEEPTGYCIDAMGVPGGGEGEKVKMMQKEKMMEVQTSEDIQTYEADLFSVQYPRSYEIAKEAGELVYISNNKGTIMIGSFFDPGAGPAPMEGMSQNEIDKNFPKETGLHGYEGNVGSALFYPADDQITKKELLEIQASIKLK